MISKAASNKDFSMFIGMSIAWWNSGCNPYGGKTFVPVQHVLQDIVDLVLLNDIVILGEFNQFDELCEHLCVIDKISQGKSVGYFNMYDKSGKSSQRHCAIFNCDLFKREHIEFKSLFKPCIEDTGENYRVGQRIRFSSPALPRMLDVYVSHWRATNDNHQNKRCRAASQIRSEINSESSDNVIVEPQGGIHNILDALMSGRGRGLSLGNKSVVQPNAVPSTIKITVGWKGAKEKKEICTYRPDEISYFPVNVSYGTRELSCDSYQSVEAALKTVVNDTMGHILEFLDQSRQKIDVAKG